MKPLISVIVPVYNTEKYLRSCLDSICKQTYENLEIICVNDGSTDGSADILAEYAAKDDRIVVITQKNAGLAAARNAALEIVKGEWITGVDSDDCVDLDAFEYCSKAMQDTTISIICYGMKRLDGVTKQIKFRYTQPAVGKQAVTPYLLKETIACFCNKIWRRSLFEQHHVQFPSGLWFEDNAVFNRIAPYVDNIMYLPGCKYNYVDYGHSIMDHATSGDLKLLDRLKVLDLIFSHYEKYPLPDHMRTLPRYVLMHHHKLLFQYLPQEHHERAWCDFRQLMEKYNLHKKSNKSFDFALAYYCPPNVAIGHWAEMKKITEVSRFVLQVANHEENMRRITKLKVLLIFSFGKKRKMYTEELRKLLQKAQYFAECKKKFAGS